jgi:HAD superfamily hydrolase (TIGR01509 family)
MTTPRLPRAVLFDMDGTLVDSEKVWDVTLQEVAATLGGRLSARTRAAMLGSNLYQSITMLHDDLDITADPAATGRLLLERTKAYFARGLPWQPGARDLLHAVRAAGLPTALVTSTHRDLVDVALHTIGRHHFDTVVCGDEVTHNKPHPEPYLRAAEQLGVPPADCVAVEDSPTGVASACAAGCTVLAVPGPVPVPPGPRRHIRTTLLGVTPADLAALLGPAPHTHDGAPPPHRTAAQP